MLSKFKEKVTIKLKQLKKLQLNANNQEEYP